MQKLIKNGAIVDNAWLAADAENEPAANQLSTLAQWQAAPTGAVQLEPGEEPAPLLDALDTLDVVAINFPAFADGRGFSYARELRERGFTGEIRAVGHFMRDQLFYLQRCGFDACAPADDWNLDDALNSLSDFSDSYQAGIDQPQPLFRRRA